MRVKHSTAVPAENVAVEGAAGVKIQWLIGHEDQPENFCMRLFELAPEGHTPRHAHPWEHEVYILAGAGQVAGESSDLEFKAGSVVHVAPGEVHQFRNTGGETLRFLCLVPKTAEY